MKLLDTTVCKHHNRKFSDPVLNVYYERIVHCKWATQKLVFSYYSSSNGAIWMGNSLEAVFLFCYFFYFMHQ